jgi:hypothetical protein
MGKTVKSGRRIRGGRTLAEAQCLTGAALVLRPTTVASTVGGTDGAPPRWLVRLLGARLLTQGLVQAVCPVRQIMIAGAAADLLHSLSMCGAAIALPRYRRAALSSAVVASVSAVLATAAVREPR